MADKIGTGEYGEILIYQTDNGQTNIEVKIEDDTVWLTQQQLTELYQCSKSNISEHIKHIFEEEDRRIIRNSGTLILSLFADLSFHLLSNIKLNMSKADYKAAYSY
ncbi:hypothetical protein [Eubacterium sp. AF22-9]|uniref:hypothetical protein n=1 Tax=Eubacterium sp. AF22-9 TaxID=2292233 RepID=UPI0026B05D2C